MPDLTSARVLADSTYLKVCSRCKRHLPVKFYYYSKASTDQLQNRCKQCGREQQAEYARKKDIPKRRTRNPEHLLQGLKECFHCDQVKPLDQFSPTSRGIGKVTAYCKSCLSLRMMRNPTEHARKAREYRAKNQDHWRQSHAAHMLRRRAVKLKQDSGLVTSRLIHEIYAIEFCYYCTQFTERIARTIEHRHPLSRGGLHHPDNLAMACRTCNISKSDRTELEYAEFLVRKRKVSYA